MVEDGEANGVAYVDAAGERRGGRQGRSSLPGAR